MTDPATLLSLRDRVALVTGASGGIGRAVVALLAEAGATVVATDLQPHDQHGGEFIPCELTAPGAVDELVDALEQRHGRLDMVVHCAGITRDRVLWKLSDADWDDVLSVNLGTAFRLLRRVTPLMRATTERDDAAGRAADGSVVLVTSINGERGKFGQANYAASKAGLIGLGRTAAKELGRFSVRVNMLAPGLIETAMTAELPEAARTAALAETALNRFGLPDDVARAILFLASGLARHVTGQVLRVDGGQLMA